MENGVIPTPKIPEMPEKVDVQVHTTVKSRHWRVETFNFKHFDILINFRISKRWFLWPPNCRKNQDNAVLILNHTCMNNSLQSTQQKSFHVFQMLFWGQLEGNLISKCTDFLHANLRLMA